MAHGGSAPQVRSAAVQRVAVAEARQHLGGQSDISPDDALLAMVREAAWNVEFYRARIQELSPGPTMLHRIDAGEIVDDDLEDLGGGLDPSQWVRHGGIYGPDHSGDGAPHVLVRLYNDEREKLVRYSKICLDAGIERRRVELEEAQGTRIASVFVAVFADVRIGLTPGQVEMGRQVASEKLRELGA